MTFRDDRPACLRCDGGLEKRGARWFCTACHSKLVPANELQDSLNEVSPDDYREIDQRLIPSLRVGARATPLMCPLCKTMMSAWTIHDVGVERCDAHGIWIDRDDDMRMILRNEEMFNARHPRVPRLGWVPFGVGIIVGAVLSPWLDRRRLRKDIEATSPKPPKKPAPRKV